MISILPKTVEYRFEDSGIEEVLINRIHFDIIACGIDAKLTAAVSDVPRTWYS